MICLVDMTCLGGVHGVYTEKYRIFVMSEVLPGIGDLVFELSNYHLSRTILPVSSSWKVRLV